MKKTKKTRSFFKHDLFGLKYKIFKIKVENCIQSEIKLKSKSMLVFLKIIERYRYAESEEDKALLRKTINAYDEMILDTETRYIENARRFLEE